MISFQITDAIIICGNDGTGKTSTAAYLNEYYRIHSPNFYVFERSTHP
jgi:broad-specificity NMP kinase